MSPLGEDNMGLDGEVGDVANAVIDRTGEAAAEPSNDGSSASSTSGEKSKGFLRLGVSKDATRFGLRAESVL